MNSTDINNPLQQFQSYGTAPILGFGKKTKEDNKFPSMASDRLRILVFNPNQGGCAYYRSIMPLQKLQEKFPDKVEIRWSENPLGVRVKPEEVEEARRKYCASKGVEYTDMTETDPEIWKEFSYDLLFDPDWKYSEIKWADVVLINNISNYGGPYLIKILQKCHELQKFIHFDTDDLLTELYEEHRLYDVYKDRKLGEITNHVYNNSHLISVTQKDFAEKIKPHCKAMLSVIRNSIDYNLPAWNHPRTESKKVRIGWAGGIHHKPDVDYFAGVPALVNQMVGPERISWDLYGHPPPSKDPEYVWQKEHWDHYYKCWSKNMKGIKNITVNPALPTAEYGSIYSKFDISIAPLADNEFNRCKSDIKVAECGRYAVPLVANDVGCYSDTIKNWKTGVLVPANASKYAFAKTLAKVIKDKAKIKEMGNNLKILTDQYYDCNRVVEDRLNIYNHSFEQLRYNPMEHRKFEDEVMGMIKDGTYGN